MKSYGGKKEVNKISWDIEVDMENGRKEEEERVVSFPPLPALSLLPCFIYPVICRIL